MSEFIEIVSPSALKNLQAVNDELVKTVANVKTVNENMIGAKTPSGSDSAIKKLTADYDAQTKTIQNLQKQLQQLANTKQQLNQKTSEEIVNQRVLRTNADRQAIANSNLAGAYRNLSAQVSIASEKYQNLIARGKTAEQTQRQYNRELSQAQREFRTLQGRVLEADKAVDKWNRTGERSIGFLRDLAGAFGITAGIGLFVQIGKDIFDTTKELQSLDMALKQVTETQSNFQQQQLFLKRISEDYGVELNSLTKQFTQFYVSAKDKISGSEIQKIFESVTKAGASMGLTVENQERAFLALNQMMSKGVVSAEELRGQLGEALPGAFGIMAKALNVNEQQLGKMMKDGKLLASDVLPKFAKQLEITYGIENVKRIDNIANAQNRLSNAWTNFVRQLNEGDGVFQKILSGTFSWFGKELEKFTEWLKSDEQKRKEYLIQLRADSKQNTEEYLDQKFKTADEKEKYAKEKIVEIESKNQATILKINQLIAENKNNFYSTHENAYKKGSFSKETEAQYISYKKNRQEIARLNEDLTRRFGILEALKEQKAKEITVIKKTQSELAKENQERERILNNQYLREISDLERKKEIIKDDLESYKGNIYGKILLSNKLADAEIAITNRVKQEKDRLAKGDKNLLKIAVNDQLTEIENSKSESVKRIVGFYKDLFDKSKEFNKDLFGDKYKMTEQQKADLKEHEEKVKKTLENMRNYLQGFINDFASSTGFTQTFDILQGKVEGFGKDFATTFVGIAESAQEAMNFITQNMGDNFAEQYAMLEKQKNVEMLFAGDTASAKANIEEQYEERKRQIANKEAQAKKKQAIFNIAIDTAQAVVATLAKTPPPAGLPLAALVATLGGIQIALVNSQEVPQFYKGTDNAPEGIAWTQEKGREIIADKSGKIKSTGSDKGAQLTYLNKGDKVFTAEKSAMMFNENLNNLLVNNGIDMPKIQINNQAITDAQINRIVETIANKETANLNIDKSGLNFYVSNGHSIKQRTNNRVTFKGQSV